MVWCFFCGKMEEFVKKNPKYFWVKIYFAENKKRQGVPCLYKKIIEIIILSVNSNPRRIGKSSTADTCCLHHNQIGTVGDKSACSVG